MKYYLEFVALNWELFLILLAIIGLVGWDIVRRKMSGVRGVSPLQLAQLTRDPTILVDVSDPAEFKKARIPNSVNVPLKKVGEDKSLEKYKSKNVVVICRSGNRSTSAAQILRKSGFENVYTLAGGIVGWGREKLPLDKG